MLIASATAGPEFIGVLVSQGTTHVAVRVEDGGSVRWVKIGDTVGEYRATAYDPERETLLLQKGSAGIELTLKTAAVQPAPTLALLESLVKNGNLGLERELQGLRTLEERRSEAAAELGDALKDPTAGDRVANLRRKLAIQESNSEFFLRALIEEARRRAKAPK